MPRRGIDVPQTSCCETNPKPIPSHGVTTTGGISGVRPCVSPRRGSPDSSAVLSPSAATNKLISRPRRPVDGINLGRVGEGGHGRCALSARRWGGCRVVGYMVRFTRSARNGCPETVEEASEGVGVRTAHPLKTHLVHFTAAQVLRGKLSRRRHAHAAPRARSQHLVY